MKLLVFSVLALISTSGYAACPAAPVGTPNDPVLQLRLNGDGKAALGPANYQASNEEGALVWDDTNDALAYCDGTNWVTLGGANGQNQDCLSTMIVWGTGDQGRYCAKLSGAISHGTTTNVSKSAGCNVYGGTVSITCDNGRIQYNGAGSCGTGSCGF